MPEADFNEFTHSLFSMPLSGAIKAVSRTEFQLVMVLLGLDDGEEKFLRYLDSSHVDGALTTLRAAGRSVPGDLSLMSFDDTVVATTTEPRLTTIHQPLEQLGELMVDVLRELVENPGSAPIRRQIPTHITWRGSV